MTIAATEAHIIATVSADLGTHVRNVVSIPSDWSDDLLKQMLVLAPFVAVAFPGGVAPKPGATGAFIDAIWEVYVGTAHASGQEARRLGDAQQMGAYDLLERVVGLLHGLTVPDVGSLELRSVDNFFTGQIEKQGLAVYGARFALPMMRFERGAVVLDDFETFDAQYDVPPHDDAAAHADWLAGNYANTAPDARDTVTLPVQP